LVLAIVTCIADPEFSSASTGAPPAEFSKIVTIGFKL